MDRERHTRPACGREHGKLMLARTLDTLYEGPQKDLILGGFVAQDALAQVTGLHDFLVVAGNEDLMFMINSFVFDAYNDL